MVRDLDAARRAGRADARGRDAAGLPAAADRARAPPAGRAGRARSAARLSPDLGVMLPYSPLHHLLLADAGEPLVMTSGNVSDEPIAYRDEDALERLGGIADLFLLHDRPIETRTDDSVRADGGGRRRRSPSCAARVATCRRASRCRCRAAAPVLACGAELKNTFCLAKGDARLGRPPHRRPRELRDPALVRGGHRALRAPVRGRAASGRPRPAPGVPVHEVRAGARGRRARRRAAPPRAPGRLPGRARRDAARRSARSTTAPGYGTDGSVWGGELLVGDLARLRARRPPVAGAAARRRRGDPRAVADGVRVARARRSAAARRPRRSSARSGPSAWRRWRCCARGGLPPR